MKTLGLVNPMSQREICVEKWGDGSPGRTPKVDLGPPHVPPPITHTQFAKCIHISRHFFFLQCWGSCSSLHTLGKCFTTSLYPQNLDYFQFLNVETKWRIKSNVSVTVLQPFLSIQDLTLFWLQLLPRHFNFLYLKKRSRKSPTQLFGAWNSRTLGTTS